MAANIGPKIGVDGEKEYRADINRIIQQAKTLDSEMRAVSASFGKSATAQEKASATAEILAKRIETQKERVKLLSDMVERSTQITDANSRSTLSWKEALNNAQAELNRLTVEQQEAAAETEDLGEAMDEAGEKGMTMGELLKANVLSQAIISGFQRLAQAAKDFAGSMITTAAEVKAENSKISQTFGDLESTALGAIQRVADNSGILSTRLNDAGSSIYAFARANGGSEMESLTLMETALQAAADSAAYYDKSLSETTETLMSFLKGNFANDAALGTSATEATRNAKAMELFGQKYNDLSEIQKQQTLLKMVTDAQALSGAAGQAAREMSGWENVTGNFNEVWRQFQAKVGGPFLENLIPIIQQVTAGFQSWTDGVDWSGFGSTVGNIFQKILDFGGWVIANGETIKNTFVVIAGAMAGMLIAEKVTMLVNAMSQYKTMADLVKAAQAALNLVMAANPITLIIGAVVGLVAALLYLWNTSESFRNGVISIWETIKGGFISAIEAIGSGLDWLKNAFLSAVVHLTDMAITAYTSVTGWFGRIVDWFNNLGPTIRDIFWNIVDAAKTWGSDLIQNFINGLHERVSALVDSLRGIAQTVRDFIGFSEPKKGPLSNFHTYPIDMMEAYARGITAHRGVLQQAVADSFDLQPYIMGGNAGPSYSYGGVNVNIYATESQSADELYDVFQYRLEHDVARKEAVYA